MKVINPVRTALIPSTLLALAAGCTTDVRPTQTLVASRLDAAPPPGQGLLVASSFLTEPTRDGLRLRVDGLDVVWESDTGWEFARYLGEGNGLGVLLAAGGHLVEVVDDDDQVVASAAVDVPGAAAPGDDAYAWAFLHGERGQAAAWTFAPAATADPDATRFVFHSAASEPIAVERCVASWGPHACEVVATIAPGATDEVMLPVGPSSTGGVGEVYLQVRRGASAFYVGASTAAACRQQGVYLPAALGVARPGDAGVLGAQPTCR